jgi:HEAT repeat protein
LNNRRSIWVAVTIIALAVTVALLMQQRRHQRESYQGRHTRDWAWALMTATNDQRRAEAVTALRAIGPDAIPPLRAMLRTRDKFYEKPIVTASRALPLEQRRELLRQLQPGSAMAVRLSALTALAQIGEPSRAALDDLVAGLYDQVGQIRWDSARCLAALGDFAIPALADAAASTNRDVRHAAVWAMSEFTTNTPQLTQALFGALLDDYSAGRSMAIYAIGKFGLDAGPMLKELLETGVPEKQLSAMRVLAAVRPPMRLVMTNVLRVAQNSTGELRRASIEAMGAMRMSNTNVVGFIISALQDSDPAVRLAAITTIGEVSWKAEAALPRLIEFVASKNLPERTTAIRTLGRFGSRGTNAVAAIQTALQDEDGAVRAAATNSLDQILTTPR